MESNGLKTIRLSLAEIAERIGGEIDGDGRVEISGAAPFETAGKEDIAFAENAALLKKIGETDAGAVIVPKQFNNTRKTLLKIENPKVAFAKVLEIFYPPKKKPEGVHPSATIGTETTCGKNVSIGPGVVLQDYVTLGDGVILHPHVVIGDHVIIGDDTEIFPNVTIFDRCRIGNRVIINAGTVIGSDGFGYAPEGETYYKIPQVGIVQIDDDVEIGACNTIDRATFGKTWIQKGVKTDNLVMIAHNVTIGENTIIIAQAGVAGSTAIGKHVILAAQAGISGHLTIEDGAVIGPQTGVVKSVAKNVVVSGSPERPHRHHLRIQHIMGRLPELKKRLDTLEKRMDAIDTIQSSQRY
jgi:UDP-3-O-[3-hydroxymyristoyl] glucosamine N-acyltransferase